MHNFGNIKNTFNQVLTESITKKDRLKKNIFKEYLKTIKESNVLKSQFLVLNNIESKFIDDSYLAGEYVKENVQSIRKFGLNKIVSENSKLISLLEKNNLKISSEENKLYECLNNLILLKKDSKNVNKLHESFEYIRSHVMKPKENEKYSSPVVSLPPSMLAGIMVSKFNNKYDNLSESEKRVIKVAISGDDNDKKSLFSDLIRETIDLVDTKLATDDIELKEKLLKTKDKLLRLEYTSDLFVKDISRLYSLKNDLSNQ
jgi:hypothetical protein